eukprot:7720684-Pyramimonas_sp.AAC.1
MGIVLPGGQDGLKHRIAPWARLPPRPLFTNESPRSSSEPTEPSVGRTRSSTTATSPWGQA